MSLVTEIRGTREDRAARKAAKLPPPTVRLYRHPARWTFNKAVELGESIPLGHVVLLAWVALYFVLFELVHPVKEFWDTLLSRHVRLLSQHNWDTWRHFFRNGGEAFLVTITVLFLTFNPYKHRVKEIDSAGKLVGRFFFAILCAVPFMVVFGLLLHHVQHWFHTGALAPDIGSHPSLAQKLYADQWTTKVAVVLAALVARRPMFPVYLFVHKYFAERRAARGKRDHWWQPAPYRARVRQYAGRRDEMAERVGRRSRAVVWLMSGGVVVVVALAVYGGYVLNHYAK